MPQINDSLHTAFVTLVADMQRLSETEVVTIIGILKELENELTATLISDPDATTTTKARLNALISQCKKNISAAYKRLNEIHQDFLAETGSAAQDAIYSIFSDVGVPLYSVMLNSDQLKSLASTALIQGAPSSSWWSKQSSGFQFSFASQIRLGFAAGETIDQIIRRIRGTSAGRGKFLIDGVWKEMTKFSGGVMEVSKRQAAALVRTSVQQLAADVRMKTFKRNSDLIECVMWSATLDHRTTLLCASRDGLTYTLDGEPIDHNLDFLGGPPAHWNCFPEYSNLQAVGKLEAVYRRGYKGKLIIFKTSSGADKHVTPNHPVLTLRGWVSADSLVVGDKVVKRGLLDGEVRSVGASNVENEIAKAHEFAKPGRFMRNILHLKVPCSAEDFHNDAVDHETAHVWADYDLLLERTPRIAEHVSKDQLLLFNAGGAIFEHGFKHLRRFGCAPCASTSSSISNELLTSFRTGSNITLDEEMLSAVIRTMKVIGYTADTNTRIEKIYSFVDVYIISVINPLPMNPIFLEDTADSSITDPIFFAYFFDGMVLPVHFDDVIDVRREDFSGYVYNLQCSSGAIILEDTITHNCRSALVPVTKSWESLGMSSKLDEVWKDALSEDTRSSLNGQVPTTMNFSEWFAKLSDAEQVLYLGKRKYEIWKNAGLTLSDLVNQQGNPLTIKQLLQKYGSRMGD